MTADKLFLLFGCAVTGAGVALGAFGAHALRKSLSPQMMSVFNTAVLYQLVHGVALLAVGLAIRQYGGSLIACAGWLLLLGTMLFSGSLYVLSITSIRYIGLLTPLGGFAFIAGWVLFFIAVLRSQP